MALDRSNELSAALTDLVACSVAAPGKHEEYVAALKRLREAYEWIREFELAWENYEL